MFVNYFSCISVGSWSCGPQGKDVISSRADEPGQKNSPDRNQGWRRENVELTEVLQWDMQIVTHILITEQTQWFGILVGRIYFPTQFRMLSN